MVYHFLQFSEHTEMNQHPNWISELPTYFKILREQSNQLLLASSKDIGQVSMKLVRSRLPSGRSLYRTVDADEHKQLNVTNTILSLLWKQSKIGCVCTTKNKVRQTYYYMNILCNVFMVKPSSFCCINILVTIRALVLYKTGSGGMFPLRQVHSTWLSAGLKEKCAYACCWEREKGKWMEVDLIQKRSMKWKDIQHMERGQTHQYTKQKRKLHA